MRPSRWWFVLAAVGVVSAAYVGARLTRGWVPHDEGTLAQSAARVGAGELPHRDFGEPYTGGLAYLDALAFRVFGTNLVAPRIVLFLVFLAWVPAVFYIASRFVASAPAGGLTLLAVAWSLPNYSAAIPSWFNLFFACFGVAALLKFLETGRTRWLLVAGVCGGLSCLIKIVGLHYVAGALLFLVYHEQNARPAPQAGGGGRVYQIVLAGALVAFVALLATVIRSRLDAADIVAFVLPGAALAGFLAWHERATGGGPSAARFATMAQLVGPFVLGMLLPVAIFLVPYVRSGALDALVGGVLVAPTRRFRFAATALPALETAWAVLPGLLVFGLAPGWRQRTRRIVTGVFGLALMICFLEGRDHLVYRDVWYSLRWLAPVAVCAGVALLASTKGRATLRRIERERLMLLLAVTAITTLVQFPFSAPVYFLYVAPLVLLTAAALVAARSPVPAGLGAATMAFYLAFAVRWIHPGFIYNMGLYYEDDMQTELLALPRGGLRVTAEDAAQYVRLVAAVQAHAHGPYAYATPDCPEVSFLSGLRNPTRTLFDFFDEPVGRTPRILTTLAGARVNVAVLNRKPAFSGPPPADLLAALAERYPRSTTVGRFEVRWRE
jgi:dolichyl-phosphate-mannose-protein mannosyltransferase